ncbi:hypothetical protein J2Z43_000205 [Clostridioides mangenotii]|uniref:Uncharacterized protein n=1 Tax=Metaclostridioides mangenotii TaxID=1540 RepID=A0ABS4E7A6_9FIRM|nr:hypothetical protein [Clostridioides mangenotii]
MIHEHDNGVVYESNNKIEKEPIIRDNLMDTL